MNNTKVCPLCVSWIWFAGNGLSTPSERIQSNALSLSSDVALLHFSVALFWFLCEH